MDIFIPDFIWFPDAELMAIISIVFMVIGAGLICTGVLLRLLLNKKGKKLTASWICIVVGSLLVINHGIQLLF